MPVTEYQIIRPSVQVTIEFEYAIPVSTFIITQINIMARDHFHT